MPGAKRLAYLKKHYRISVPMARPGGQNGKLRLTKTIMLGR